MPAPAGLWRRAIRPGSSLQDQQTKTLAAERDKTWEQALSHWKEARIARAARQPGQRCRSLEALAAAVQELRSLGQLEANRAELRDDAIASLTLWDVRPVGHLSGGARPRLLRRSIPWAATTLRRGPEPGLLAAPRGSPGHPPLAVGGRPLCRPRCQPGRPVRLRLSATMARVANSELPRLGQRDRPGGAAPPDAHGWEHAFRPDGKVLALVQADGSIALCDLGTGRDLPPLPAGRMPQCLRFHPGGRYLAVSSHAHDDAEVWDLAAGKVVLPAARRSLRGSQLWPGAPTAPSWPWAAMTTTSTCARFPEGTFRRCCAVTNMSSRAVEYHPSGRLLASTSHDDTTRLWCFSPGGELVLPGERLLGFSRDGRRLITASREGVTQWELVDPGDCLHYLPYGEGPTRGPWGIAFAPDGRLLASASLDGVLLWDAAAARQIGRVPSGWGYPWPFRPMETSCSPRAPAG